MKLIFWLHKKLLLTVLMPPTYPHHLLLPPPVSPPRSPTTTSLQCRALRASQCRPSPSRPPCPACRPATAARHRPASTSCAAPTAAAKPACSTTTTRPAATSSLCWRTRWVEPLGTWLGCDERTADCWSAGSQAPALKQSASRRRRSEWDFLSNLCQTYRNTFNGLSEWV